MNKRYILFAIVGLAIFIPIFLYSLKSTQKPAEVTQKGYTPKTTRQSDSGVNAVNSTRTQQPSPTPEPTLVQAPVVLLRSPEDTAKRFYIWYISTPEPLASGAYLGRQDLTDEYKNVMGRYVTRGLPADRDPIFNCGTFPLPQAVNVLSATYDFHKLNALVILQTLPEGKNEFQLKLRKTGDNWQIRDVWCAP